MAAPGHFFGAFLLFQEEVSASLRAPGSNRKARRRRRASGLLWGSDGRLRRLFLHHPVFVLALALRALGTAAGTLGKRGFDLLDRLGLGDALHHRDFAREPIERGLVELALRIGLLGLSLRAVKVAHHLGDRNDVA